MLRRVNFAVALAVVGSFTLPGARPASADDDATVQDVWMLVDAKINGKDLWSPGGRELALVSFEVPISNSVQRASAGR